MRRLVLLTTASAILFQAVAAEAQVANRSIGVEAGMTSPSGAGAALPFAICASTWIDGGLEATARVGGAAVPWTADRGAAGRLEVGAGLRLSLLSGPLRPQLLTDLALRTGIGAGGIAEAQGLAIGAGIGVELFLATSISAALAASAREVVTPESAALEGEVRVRLSAWF